MLRTHRNVGGLHPTPLNARLFLGGRDVGHVRVRATDSAWTFGEFTPGEGFAVFAPYFATWSLMMHADGEGERLSQAALEELRHAECAIDSIRARVYLIEARKWRAIEQLNIDGPLIEWKERQGPSSTASPPG